MKKLLLTFAGLAVCVSAFAQGKVTFGNDGTRLITFSNFNNVPVRDQAFAELAAPQEGTPNDRMSLLTAEWFAGTTAGNIQLQATDIAAGFTGLADGRLAQISVTLVNVPAGAAFFQLRLFETAAGNYATASAPNSPFLSGITPIFSGTAGSFAPTPVASSGGWAAGPVFIAAAVPEPGTIALAGLGLASLLIFRRRK